MIAVSIDGVLVDAERAAVSVFDRGFLYGDGCFEVLRTWGGVARDLDAHLDRLFETASFLQLKTIERPRLVDAVDRTVAAAGPTRTDRSRSAAKPGSASPCGEGPPCGGPGEHRLRIVLTRGPGGLAARLAELPAGAAIVIVEPLTEAPDEITLAVVDWPLPRRDGRGHKTLAYLDHVIARELARAGGADEALRLDAEGRAVEGATCNLFVVAGDTVMTPPADTGALPGIVRARVLALCAAAGVRAVVRPISLADVRGAGELFVTSSLRGVVPVARLDGVPCPRGPITGRLARAYAGAMRGDRSVSDL